MSHTFVDVVSEDIELLERCSIHYSSCWKETYGGRLPEMALNELLEQSCVSEIKSWLIGHGERSLTALNHDEDIAGCIASNCISDRCYVWGMYVRQKNQRSGIGGMLLDRVVQTAKQCESKAIEITVLESSSEAIEFYRSRGFVKIDTSLYEITNGIELSSVIMELEIC